MSRSTPSPVTADIGKRGRTRSAQRAWSVGRRVSWGRSILLAAMTRGRVSSSGLKARSSSSTTASASRGSLAVSETSMTCTNRRVRSICRRKRIPRPAPKDAPSIRPGMSAATKAPSGSISTVPSCGVRVVKGYSATFEWAAEIQQRRADFPALGRPIRPTSASSFKVR